MKNIVLIGFAGCGKTTTGRIAAKKLHMRFFDCDREIEKKCGCSIADIFAAQGAAAFRVLESEMLTHLMTKKNSIISTGGGCVTVERNKHILKQNGHIIYLRSSPERIFKNIGNDTTRPLLQTEDKLGAIREMMAARAPLYEAFSDTTIDISGFAREGTIAALVETIRRLPR